MSAGRAISASVRAWLNEPDAEATRWRRAVVNVCALVVHCAHQLRRDRAPQMAAALAYRTIFGLIPTLVLSLIVLRFFYADSIEEPLRRVLASIGLSEIALPTDAATDIAASNPDTEVQSERVGAWIEMLVERVSQINFAAIGVVGVAVLIYAALSLMNQVEQAFNTIYKATTGRNLIARITQYWTILTLGPIGVLVSFWLSDRAKAVVGAMGGGGALSSLGAIPAFAVSWLVLLLAFKVIPNTRVRMRPALLGSFVAAILWEFGKWGFSLYLGFATGYARFYGALGLIPLFMLWIYITWLIVLFGVELTYATQTFQRGLASFRRDPFPRGEPQQDLSLALMVLAGVGESFDEGDAATAAELAHRIEGDAGRVEAALRTLEHAGFVHPVEQGDEGPSRYALSRPPGRIELNAVIEAVSPGGQGFGGPAGRMIHEAILGSLRDRPLTALLAESRDGARTP